jgi:lipopolysaccharide export system permease protein
MKRIGLLIPTYLIRTILPYFVFSWLLLSVILFVQQAGRFADIFFNVNLPAMLVWQLMIALIPNVIAFTCPMAVLVGTVIGLAKMQGDSELVAIRAAGVGNLQLTLPILLLGAALSGFAFLVNLEGVPLAARLVRQVAIKSAIQKLESPIEPGVFNNEIAGYTVYVRSGDITSGQWQDIFVYHEDPAAGTVRLITSKQGRVDVTGQTSELVLENASVTTFPSDASPGKYVTENIGDVRLSIKTKRSEMIEKLASSQGTPEELGLSELAEYAATKEGADRVEAQILWQRRLLLSITPFIFCLLGSAMMLRTNRGGRGFGTFLALSVLVVYYLISFLGEQMARVGNIPVLAGALLPIVASLALVVWLHFSRKFNFLHRLVDPIKQIFKGVSATTKKIQPGTLFVDLTTGLRDLDLLANLAKYFLLTLAFLGTLSLVFTAFELWKFAGSMAGGTFLLGEYLFFLTPFLYLQYLAPTAAMLAILATYVIKSRQNEIVTWISAGQSIYRLLAPCFIAMLVLGAFNWALQEQVLPRANQIQDKLRTEIRSRGQLANKGGRYWTFSNGQIVSFELTPASDNEQTEGQTPPPDNSASDNEKPLANIQIFQLNKESGRLQTIYQSPSANWQGNHLLLAGPVRVNQLENGLISSSVRADVDIDAQRNPLVSISDKPSYLSRRQINERIAASGSDTEKNMFTIALQKRNATPLLPLIIAFFTAPFALSLSRKGKVATVGGAIGLWLLYIGLTNIFEQFGLNGLLPPEMAVWASLALFTLLGVYLLSRIRT